MEVKKIECFVHWLKVQSDCLTQNSEVANSIILILTDSFNNYLA